ncbi:MAG: Cof-type HAD-IIB family hydrolase [Firmicutes bacterium]|nr:Cof-type HAD-IIB family hydrolase [Bacillota bacterium]
MSYKLVVVDLDGTLVLKNPEVSPKNKEEIRRIQNKSVIFSIASGRMFSSILPYAEELDIKVPLICYGGAMLVDSVTKKVLYQVTVPLETAKLVIRVARAFDLHVNLHIGENVYIEKERTEAEAYCKNARVKAIVVGDLLSFIKEEPTKLIVISENVSLLDEVGEIIRNQTNGKLNITKSFPTYLEVVNREASKGKALEMMAAILKIEPEEVMAVGDSFNDIDMLEWAGLGIAMGNAPGEVKEAANYITASFEEDGVALALERFIE